MSSQFQVPKVDRCESVPEESIPEESWPRESVGSEKFAAVLEESNFEESAELDM